MENSFLKVKHYFGKSPEIFDFWNGMGDALPAQNRDNLTR